MAAGEHLIYRFGDYRIDTARFEIARRAQPLAVEPQVLDLLIALIARHDRVVSKDELLDIVWQGRVVSETTLSSRIKTARHVIGDDGARQDWIRTIHGRGFRFVGAVDIEAAPPEPSPKPAAPVAADRPLTRYARSGDIHIAYQVFGSGPVNLVLAPGFISHVDKYWDSPAWARCLRRLGGLARVAVFDKRGTGMSDRVTAVPGLDERMDDLRAVMDAAGFETAFVMGISEGGSMAALFAACHPSRCDGLLLYGAFAQFKYWFPDEASLQQLYDYIESDWGSGKSLARFAPSANDAEFQRWWGTFECVGATPGSAIALMQMNSRIDISHVLPSIHVPTLVMHVADDALIDVRAGRELAAGIPGARYVEWPGVDHLPMIEPNASRIVGEVAAFIEQQGDRRRTTDRVLAAILLLECSGKAATAQAQLERFRVNRICSRPDGLAAVFDGPARALEAALSTSRLLRAQGVRHRMAVHTGEVGIESAELRGTTMDIARDVIAHAAADEILASRTVADLVAGTGIALEDRGEVALPAVGQAWHLYRVAP